MPSTIVIIGATGAQGGGVARAVAANKSFDTIKVASRNINSNSMKILLETIGEGAQAVQMDLDDKSSVQSAFEGADAVFGTFNYWGTSVC